MKEVLNAILSRRIVRLLRDTGLKARDCHDALRGRGDQYTPPRSLQHYVGGGDFHAIGNEFYQYFLKLGKLSPDEDVLDIGCGTGRMAIPLLRYLNERGSYTGFDVSGKAIAWCQRQVSSAHPGFKFIHADIYNLEYNDSGKISASDFRFPCDDESIDFAFATSVFTHMKRAEVVNYLGEIRRVLRSGGRSLVTFFILNDVSRRQMERGSSSVPFSVALDGCFTIDPKTPERAIAYTEESVRQMHEDAGLRIIEPIHFGSWSGRSEFLSFQDIVLARRN